MKRFLCFTLAALCLFTCLCSCNNTPAILQNTMSEGDFIYNLNTDGSGTAVILGFTEEGLQKEVLIVPETIGGYPVRNYNLVKGNGCFGSMVNDTVRYIYFPYHIKIARFAFNHCSQLQKVFLLDPTITDNFNKATVFYPHTEGAFSSNYANVTYLSDGEIYWIDDYDYGTKILYQPPEPVKSDAVFAGWYKEPECITQWNFDTDTLPEAKGEEGYSFQYQETKLYAKWDAGISTP